MHSRGDSLPPGCIVGRLIGHCVLARAPQDPEHVPAGHDIHMASQEATSVPNDVAAASASSRHSNQAAHLGSEPCPSTKILLSVMAWWTNVSCAGRRQDHSRQQEDCEEQRLCGQERVDRPEPKLTNHLYTRMDEQALNELGQATGRLALSQASPIMHPPSCQTPSTAGAAAGRQKSAASAVNCGPLWHARPGRPACCAGSSPRATLCLM